MNEIMQALYARLTGQLAIGVYDHVPQDNTDYPFIRINPIQTEEYDTDILDSFRAVVRIIGFSRYRGLSELNTIMDDVYSALHHWAMPDTANYSVGTFVEDSRQVINDPDGLTRNSIQQFVFYIDKL